VTSATRGSAKTLLLDILSEVCANCPGRLSNLTEANLFRLAHEGKTLILDESENLQTEDRQRYGALMSVFNDGFKSGGKVPRQEREKDGNFKTFYFNTYSPKVLAGLSEIQDTIADRSFKIVMTKKTSKEHTERFNLRSQREELTSLREEMSQWAKAHSNGIGDIYNNLGDGYERLKSLALDDRLVDIAEPLTLLADICDYERQRTFRFAKENLLKEVTDLLRTMSSRRKENVDPAVKAIIEISREVLGLKDRVFLPTESFRAKLSAKQLYLTGKALAGRMEKLNINPTSDGEKRGYWLTQNWIQDTEQRYLGSAGGEEVKQKETSKCQ
jgi:hypothetical protein